MIIEFSNGRQSKIPNIILSKKFWFTNSFVDTINLVNNVRNMAYIISYVYYKRYRQILSIGVFWVPTIFLNEYFFYLLINTVASCFVHHFVDNNKKNNLFPIIIIAVYFHIFNLQIQKKRLNSVYIRETDKLFSYGVHYFKIEVNVPKSNNFKSRNSLNGYIVQDLFYKNILLLEKSLPKGTTNRYIVGTHKRVSIHPFQIIR